MVTHTCRRCKAEYKLGVDSGSRYYCKTCMSDEPYGFAQSKLLGQIISMLDRYVQIRIDSAREIARILDLAVKKGFRQRDIQRLRDLAYHQDEKTRAIILGELESLRTDEPEGLPGVDIETEPTGLPGLSDEAVVLPGLD